MSKLSFVTDYKPEKEKTLLELAIKNGVEIKYSCGKGKCGKCKVEILEGDCEPPTKEELKVLNPLRSKTASVSLAAVCLRAMSS